METNKKQKDVSKEFLSRVKATIKSKLPKEALFNHSMVGINSDNSKITFLWQPHNYRLYFDFNKDTFIIKKPCNHTLKKYQSMVGIFNIPYTYTPLNFDSEHKYDNFMFCQIRVKKNQIEVINKSHNKQWRKITADNIDDIDLKIDEVMNQLKEQSIEALKSFIDLHKGFSKFNILNERCEHGIHGEEYLNKIPRELIIHDTHFKKLYKKKVELFKTAGVKSYMSNRTVEKIAPAINDELGKLHSLIINDVTPVFETFRNEIKTHMKVQYDTLKTNQQMRKTLQDISANIKPQPRPIKKNPYVKQKYGLTDNEMDILRNF